MDPNEETMWLRLKDAQREAETRRLLRKAARARSGRRRGSHLGRWFSAARQLITASLPGSRG